MSSFARNWPLSWDSVTVCTCAEDDWDEDKLDGSCVDDEELPVPLLVWDDPVEEELCAEATNGIAAILVRATRARSF